MFAILKARMELSHGSEIWDQKFSKGIGIEPSITETEDQRLASSDAEKSALESIIMLLWSITEIGSVSKICFLSKIWLLYIKSVNFITALKQSVENLPHKVR